MADDNVVEACLLPFPPSLSDGRPPRFFRVVVAPR